MFYAEVPKMDCFIILLRIILLQIKNRMIAPAFHDNYMVTHDVFKDLKLQACSVYCPTSFLTQWPERHRDTSVLVVPPQYDQIALIGVISGFNT